jgi:CBS domain-containing protein
VAKGAALVIATTVTELRSGTVGEAMTPGVLTCLPVTPLRDVARMMARHRVHAIVVLADDDRLHPWGVVSDLDLVGAIGTCANAGVVAASPVVTVTPDLALEQAAMLMAENQTSHLLVRSDMGLPVGVLSTLDIARALAAGSDPGES